MFAIKVISTFTPFYKRTAKQGTDFSNSKLKIFQQNLLTKPQPFKENRNQIYVFYNVLVTQSILQKTLIINQGEGGLIFTELRSSRGMRVDNKSKNDKIIKIQSQIQDKGQRAAEAQMSISGI